MVKKKKEEISLELTDWEKTEASAITDSRQTLAELQKAVIPYAEELAKRQRQWWDRFLDDRGLSRETINYSLRLFTVTAEPIEKEE